MFYASGAVYNYLSQDDADAITYLYPHDPILGGLGGNCGSVTINPRNGPERGKNTELEKALVFLNLFFIWVLCSLLKKNFNKRQSLFS